MAGGEQSKLVGRRLRRRTTWPQRDLQRTRFQRRYLGTSFRNHHVLMVGVKSFPLFSFSTAQRLRQRSHHCELGVDIRKPLGETVESHWVLPQILEGPGRGTVHQVRPPFDVFNNVVDGCANGTQSNVELLVELRSRE